MTTELPEHVWEEARGPHLPDWTARIPGPAWAFLAVSALVAWRSVEALIDYQMDDPLTILVASLSAASRIAAPLLGVALFLRHPDAIRAHRLLALGCALLAAATLGAAFRSEAMTVLEGLAGDSESFGPIPWSTAYGAAVTLAAGSGLLALGLGLRDARRRPSGLSEGRLLLVASTVPIATALVGVATIVGMTGQDEMVAAYFLSTAVSLAPGLGWAVLAVEASSGVSTSEAPWSGWRMAAVAAWGMLATRLVSLLEGVASFVAPDAASTIGSLFSVGSVATALLWFLLLLAFAAGLPADRTDAPTVTP